LVTGAFDEGAPAIGDLPAGLAQAMSTSHEKRLALEEATAAGTDGRCGSSARLLGEVARHKRPEHLTAVLGEVPELPACRRSWVAGAAVIETLRRRLGLERASLGHEHEERHLDIFEQLGFSAGLEREREQIHERDRGLGL
jgi:hypothetical protein